MSFPRILRDGAHSKWFSESSRNVGMLFDNVHEMAKTSDLLIIMIDEVESLSSSRATAASGAEPSDSLRVVNSLLTAIDTLRTLPNVLVIATSNLTDRIDTAFLDRADVKQYIGLPNVHARYEILRGGVDELLKCGIVRDTSSASPNTDLSFDTRLMNISLDDNSSTCHASHQGKAEVRHVWSSESQKLLLAAAAAAEGLSGRRLRKLCLFSHARLSRSGSVNVMPLDLFLASLHRVASSEALQVSIHLKENN